MIIPAFGSVNYKPLGFNPFQFDPMTSLAQFAVFRAARGRRYPWFTPTAQDHYGPDSDLENKALAELKSVRHDWPNAGVWFSEETGKCGICGCDGKLVVDHCHSTGLARGMLCVGCNTQEGKSNDARFRAWRLTAPFLEIGSRFIYKRECQDCEEDRLMYWPIVMLLDYHDWWEVEWCDFIHKTPGLSIRGRYIA